MRIPGRAPLGRCLTALCLAMLGACAARAPGTSPGVADSGPGHAKGGPAPVAYLWANTGGDSLGARGQRGVALEMHVIDGDRVVEPVARCDRIAGGSALGGGTPRELQAALCEGDAHNRGEYWLISEPGVVSVRRGPIGSSQQIVLEYRLRDARASAVAGPVQ